MHQHAVTTGFACYNRRIGRRILWTKFDPLFSLQTFQSPMTQYPSFSVPTKPISHAKYRPLKRKPIRDEISPQLEHIEKARRCGDPGDLLNCKENASVSTFPQPSVAESSSAGVNVTFTSSMVLSRLEALANHVTDNSTDQSDDEDEDEDLSRMLVNKTCMFSAWAPFPSSSHEHLQGNSLYPVNSDSLQSLQSAQFPTSQDGTHIDVKGKRHSPAGPRPLPGLELAGPSPLLALLMAMGDRHNDPRASMKGDHAGQRQRLDMERDPSRRQCVPRNIGPYRASTTEECECTICVRALAKRLEAVEPFTKKVQVQGADGPEDLLLTVRATCSSNQSSGKGVPSGGIRGGLSEASIAAVRSSHHGLGLTDTQSFDVICRGVVHTRAVLD